MLKFLNLAIMLLECLIQVFLDRKGPHLFFLLFDVLLGKENLVSDVIDPNNQH